ncbi:hypothetical protein LSTR_LSTR004665 [Laodelphax striatellus]|uniref:Phlebovirus glycoprotein G1 domain-containing protein n=1 Tax=Laodelphax striatellus TaxID=195883 RepID=A0A482WTR6_LAOST|nr:hypothetical protein LSTR_LSTR004665 [Laodelphax striatellus]
MSQLSTPESHKSRKLLGLNFAQDLHGKSESFENEIFLKPVFNSSALTMLKPYDRNGSSTILRKNYLSKIDLTTNSDFKQIINLLVKMEKENFLVGDYSECEVPQLDYPFQTICENIKKTECLKAFIYLKIEGHSLICHHAVSWTTNDLSSPCERYTEPCYKNSTKYLFSNQEFKVSASLRNAEKELPLFTGRNACGFYKTDCGEGSTYIEKYTKVWWWLDNFGLHYLTELDVVYKTLHDEIIGYSCVNTHLNVSSGCSGDKTYCKYFKCSVDTKCFCELDNSVVHITVRSSNMSLESPAWLLGESYEKLFYKVNSVKSVPFETGNIMITCNKNVIKVENFQQDVSLIEVCIHPECVIAQSPKISHDFYFNFDAFSQDVTVLVTVTNSKSDENKILKHCPKINKCSNLPCYFCVEKVLAYDCYNKLEFIFASIVIGMLTSFFIAFVFWLFTLFKAFLLVFTGVLWSFKVLKFTIRILMNFFSPLKRIMFRFSGLSIGRNRKEKEPLLPVSIKHTQTQELLSHSLNNVSAKMRPKYRGMAENDAVVDPGQLDDERPLPSQKIPGQRAGTYVYYDGRGYYCENQW